MTIGHAHGGNGSIHVIDTSFRSFDGGGGRHTGGCVALHVDGDIQLFLQAADQIIGHVRLENTGHVLDRDGVCAHVGDFFRQIYPHIDGVHRAGGVSNRALGMLAGLANGLDRTIHVAGIVHGIKNTEHVYAVLGGTLTETVNHIIRIVTIAQQILATQKHLLAGIGHGFFKFADALPGVFAQVTDTGVKGSSTPGFQRPETHFVEFLSDWQHVVQTHAGGEQGLVGVTQNYVRNPQRFFRVSHRVSLLLKGSNRVPGSLLVA